MTETTTIGHDGKPWPQTMDGMAWAVECEKRFPCMPASDGVGWFANAIMAGYDEAQWRNEAELATLRAQLAGVRERVEKVQRYVPVEGFAGRAEMEKCDWGIWCELDDVLAALDGAA